MNQKEIKNLIKKAGSMQHENSYKSIELLELAITNMKEADKDEHEYDWLYAHYGIMNYSATLIYQSNLSQIEEKNYKNIMIEYAQKCMDILEPTINAGAIFHYTDIGAFQEEVIRYASNALAWSIHESTNNPTELEKALDIIDLGCNYVDDDPDYFYVYDTKVRILLKMEQKEEAYQIVRKCLIIESEFEDFEDFLENKDYLQWLKAFNSGPLQDLTEEEKTFLEEMQTLTQKTKANYEALLAQEFPKENTITSTVLTIEEAKKQFEIVSEFNSAIKFLVLTGNIYIEGNLDIEWMLQKLQKFNIEDDGETGIMIIGNVFIKGNVLDKSDDDCISILIIGNVTCAHIHSDDGEILINGDANIITTLTGEYNHGLITITGKTNVPFILNSDHYISTHDEAIWIEHFCNYRNNTKFIDKYKYLDCQRLLSPKVWTEKDEFSRDNFTDLLKAGESPFRSI